MHLPCLRILVFHYKSIHIYKKMSHFSQAGGGGVGDGEWGGGGAGHNRVTHIHRHNCLSISILDWILP